MTDAEFLRSVAKKDFPTDADRKRLKKIANKIIDRGNCYKCINFAPLESVCTECKSPYYAYNVCEKHICEFYEHK